MEIIMIKLLSEKITNRAFAQRICDDCGKVEEKTYKELLDSESRKKLGKDYCKKCAYKYRVLNLKSGKDSVLYKNGLSLNKTSGYLRINKTGEYYHKIIFGNFLGRKITREEQVHHIDFNKLNNEVSNLFLCKNKKDHYFLHYKLELLTLSFLNKYIYFDRENRKYITTCVCNEKIDFKFDNKDVKSIIQWKWRNGKEYEFGYLGNRKHRILHGLIYEQYIGRKTKTGEHIHHIDGNTLNNEINNLILLNRSEHKMCHNSLWDCAKELFKSGVIKFNNGEYYCE
jgi:hypothetical protein